MLTITNEIPMPGCFKPGDGDKDVCAKKDKCATRKVLIPLGMDCLVCGGDLMAAPISDRVPGVRTDS